MTTEEWEAQVVRPFVELEREAMLAEHGFKLATMAETNAREEMDRAIVNYRAASEEKQRASRFAQERFSLAWIRLVTDLRSENNPDLDVERESKSFYEHVQNVVTNTMRMFGEIKI